MSRNGNGVTYVKVMAIQYDVLCEMTSKASGMKKM